MELTSVKDDADQSRRIDKYGPATLLAGRQLHAGRSVFLLQYDWWPAGRVSSASVLAQWAPKFTRFPERGV